MSFQIDRRAVNRAIFAVAAASLAPFSARSQDTQPAQEIVGLEWLAETIRDFEVADRIASTLTISSDGKVAGSGGCNRYFGNATIDGETIIFSELATTHMACREEAMAQESAFLAALALVASYSLEGGKLVLAGEDGQPIVTLTTSA